MNKIKGYRVMLNMTQEQMAKKLDISRQAYSEKERGNIHFNDREKIILKKMFSQLDKEVSIDSLFFAK